MRIGIVSDFHLGDPDCALLSKTAVNDDYYRPLVEALRPPGKPPLDYLALLGDVFDFSVVSYQEALSAAQIFFKRLQKDGLCERIIYVPGNHDYFLWHLVEVEVNITVPLKAHPPKPPSDFRWAVPGVLKPTDAHGQVFTLPHVKRNPNGGYGGLFLEHGLTPGDHPSAPPSQGGPIPWSIAYPNLYLEVAGEVVLLTHGHYFETYWALGGEIGPELMADGDWKDSHENRVPDRLGVKNLVAFNSLLTQLACSDIGQAGALTNAVRRIQKSANFDPKLKDLRGYIDRLEQNVIPHLIADATTMSRATKCAIRRALPCVKKRLLRELLQPRANNQTETRNDGAPPAREHPTNPKADRDRDQRIRGYMKACAQEADGLNRQDDRDPKLGVKEKVQIQAPTQIIYGHTHHPVPWSATVPAIPTADRSRLVLHNGGGWLLHPHTRDFCGAEVFIYEDDRLSSVSIGQAP